ncbi:MAG: hypothetical protein HZB14_10505 [Actinobacteria bacterium]|nr:hypothetical protein [Actinomycetota bacterium]
MRNAARYAKLFALATALLVVAGSAQAAGVTVKPTTSVESATKSGKHVRFQIVVKFPIPAGASATDCSGKVTVSTRLSKKKTAKWSGKLAALGPDCVARIKARLASAKYGKKLKFSVAFGGSTKLKSFSRSLKLKIVAPPPPTPPLPPAAPPAPPAPPALEAVGVHNKGSWDINAIGDDNADFEFFIKPDYSVSEITTYPSGKVQLQCESTNPQASITFNTGFMAKSDNITVQSTQNDAFFISMVHTFHFDWTSPTGGVGQYSSSGQYNVGTEESPDWENCTGGFNFELEHFGSVT